LQSEIEPDLPIAAAPDVVRSRLDRLQAGSLARSPNFDETFMKG
jgi:hypothetical protein